MTVSWDCYVFLGRGLCDGLITHPEESYRVWSVVVCDLDTSVMRRPCPTEVCCAKRNLNELKLYLFHKKNQRIDYLDSLECRGTLKLLTVI